MNPDRRQALDPVLKVGHWFDGLPAALQEEILDHSVERSFAAGQMISPQDAPPQGLFLLLKGQARFEQWASPDASILFHIGDPGLWFGELALLLDGVTAVAVSAHTDVRTLLLPVQEFERIVEEEPRYYRCFARLALERSALYLRLLAQSQSLSPMARLRARLADIAEIRARESRCEGVVEVDITQADLATMVGASRQTVNRLLRQLADSGLIAYSFRRIRILDPAGLRGQLPSTGIGPGPWLLPGRPPTR